MVQRATDDYRAVVLELLTRLAHDAGAADAAALRLQLHLLYHGAAVLPGPERRAALAAAIRPAAQAVVDAALAAPGHPGPHDGDRL